MATGEFNIAPRSPSLRFADVLDSAMTLMKKILDTAIFTDELTVRQCSIIRKVNCRAREGMVEVTKRPAVRCDAVFAGAFFNHMSGQFYRLLYITLNSSASVKI